MAIPRNPKLKTKKHKLISNPENRYLLDPVTKEVFYNEGNNIGELEPKWVREKK